MTSAIGRLRPLLISVIALVLTAGIAFAAKPTSNPGHPLASQAAGTTGPVATEGQETAEPDESAEPDATSEPDTNTSTDSPTTTANDNCATDPTTLTADQLAARTQGSIVCRAAHQPTPSGYANHGAWVSHWAKQNAGKGAGHSNKP